MAPGFEAIWFAQVRQPPPGEDEGVLQGVLGETWVAQDPLGYRVQRVADLVHQGRERLTVSPLSLLDQVSIHPDLRPPTGRSGADIHYDGRSGAERSAATETRGLRRPVRVEIGRAGVDSPACRGTPRRGSETS